MVIVVMASYPTESAKEMGKNFIKSEKERPMPDFLTRTGPFLNSSLEQGHRAIVIYSSDNSKMAEAVRAIEERMAFFLGVPGLTYSVQVWSEIGEYLKTIGVT